VTFAECAVQLVAMYQDIKQLTGRPPDTLVCGPEQREFLAAALAIAELPDVSIHVVYGTPDGSIRMQWGRN
jgi:hypothetical protein